MREVSDQLGQNVRRERELAGVTQEELADRCELDRTEISMIERGHKLPRLDTLVKLARGLELPLAELLAGIS